MISGLKTNFNPSLSYSVYKSFNNKHNIATEQFRYFTYCANSQKGKFYKVLWHSILKKNTLPADFSVALHKHDEMQTTCYFTALAEVWEKVQHTLPRVRVNL